MLLELVLVLGFVVPLLLPVTAAAMLFHAAAFQMCVTKKGTSFEHEVRSPVRYLWFSLSLGVGLVLWLFWECSWAGQTVVLVGAPLALALGAGTAEVAIRHKPPVEIASMQDLAEPLLDLEISPHDHTLEQTNPGT